MIKLLRDFPLYQLKVTLVDSQPAIWRRFQVNKEATLLKLHDILQIVMGWDDAHLHEFKIGELRFGAPEPDEDYDVIDEAGVKLVQVAPTDPITFEYVYDFGDGWQHEVAIECGVDKKTGVRYPTCVEGPEEFDLEAINRALSKLK